MRFIRVHEFALAGLLGSAFLALASTGELPAWIVWPAPALMIAGFLFPIRRPISKAFNAVLLITLAAFFGFCAFATDMALAVAMSGFVLSLTVIRLFERQHARHTAELQLFSFLICLAASAMHNSLSFGLWFAFYILFAVWSLILAHLRLEVEDSDRLRYPPDEEEHAVRSASGLNVPGLINLRFLFTTGICALVIALATLGSFFLFPRIGFGLFAQKSRPSVSSVGFSDSFALGQFGRILDDPTVAFRVESSKDLSAYKPLYWRGVAFDHYDGRKWSRTQNKLRSLKRRSPWQVLRCLTRDQRCFDGNSLPENALTLQIYLEPMDAHVLFALETPYAFQLESNFFNRQQIQKDPLNAVHYTQQHAIAFKYTAVSIPEDRSSSSIPLERLKQDALFKMQPYLQLPELDARIPALAASWVQDAETLDEALSRLKRGLQKDHQYSLDIAPFEGDPIVHFLFEDRKGHCEYFATASALLLRTQGIPARVVNGFLGGQWNELGDYLAVRQGDAHAWVEVWNGEDWILYDTTPSSPREAATANFGFLAQWIDNLQLWWMQTIIEYDLAEQLAALRRLSNWFKGAFGSGDETQENASKIRHLKVPALILGVTGLLAAVFFWLYRRKKRATTELHPASELYEMLLRFYEKQGFCKPKTMTARQFSELLKARNAPSFDLACEIAAFYEASRFEEQPIDRAALQSLKRRLQKR